MKRFAVLLLALAMTVCCALPAFAAGTIEVTEDVSVSDDYDWTRFKGQNVAINVYNWGEYISDGSEGSHRAKVNVFNVRNVVKVQPPHQPLGNQPGNHIVGGHHNVITGRAGAEFGIHILIGGIGGIVGRYHL